ncbi:MAG: 23S rRNA (guanosine(2251)-2'-O)-methyltransferase RlmB [Christensenellales bacterium]
MSPKNDKERPFSDGRGKGVGAKSQPGNKARFGGHQGNKPADEPRSRSQYGAKDRFDGAGSKRMNDGRVNQSPEKGYGNRYENKERGGFEGERQPGAGGSRYQKPSYNPKFESKSRYDGAKTDSGARYENKGRFNDAKKDSGSRYEAKNRYDGAKTDSGARYENKSRYDGLKTSSGARYESKDRTDGARGKQANDGRFDQTPDKGYSNRFESKDRSGGFQGNRSDNGGRDQFPAKGNGSRFANQDRRGYSADKQRREGVSFDQGSKRYPDQKKPYVTKRDAEPDTAQTPADSEQTQNEEQYFLMGRNPVREAIKAGRSIDKILVAKGELEGSIREILKAAYDTHLVVKEVTRQKLDELCMPFGHSGMPGNHQGIIAYVPAKEYCTIADMAAYAEEKGEKPFIVALDNLEDPHNLGAIIRSAECAGVHGVVICKHRSVGVNAAVARASAGAAEYMRVAKTVNMAAAIKEMKQLGLWIVGLSMEGEPLYKSNLKGAVALIVGSEGGGLSRLVKEQCDFLLSIPVKGNVESLNASVAASVAMYEKVRQESV